MADEITVGMGRLFVVDKPATLTCLGLGSCIAVMLYDKEAGVSGLAHIMLPDSSKARFQETEYSSLLAEQDEYNLKTLKNALTGMGYEIKAITDNTDDTLKKFQELKPYLLILDSELSDNPGCSIVEEIFKINRAANIVVTNMSNSMDYIDLLSMGVLDVISRPLTRDKVNLVLEIVSSLRYLRFADVAVEKMIKRMVATGAHKENLKAKLAGGSDMFNHSQVESRNIGEENYNTITEILKKENIPVVDKDVGGNIGRTVRFSTSEFKVTIHSRDGEKEI